MSESKSKKPGAKRELEASHGVRKAAGVREATFESSFVDKLEGLGAWVIKLLPSVAGLPDRLVLLPYGRLIFVELKTNTGRVRPIQTARHNKLRTLGFDVRVIRPNQANAFIKECEELIRIDGINDMLQEKPDMSMLEDLP